MDSRDPNVQAGLGKSQFSLWDLMAAITAGCILIAASALTSLTISISALVLAGLVLGLCGRLNLSWQIGGVLTIAASAGAGKVFTMGHLDLLRNTLVAGSLGALVWLYWTLKQFALKEKSAVDGGGFVAVAMIFAGIGYGIFFALLSATVTQVDWNQTWALILLGVIMGMMIGLPYLILWVMFVTIRRCSR